MIASIQYTRGSYSVRELTQVGEGEQRYALRAFLDAPIFFESSRNPIQSFEERDLFLPVETGIRFNIPPGFYIRVVSPGSIQHPPAFQINETIITPEDNDFLRIVVLNSSSGKISNGDVVAHLIVCEYPKCFVVPTN